MTLIHIRRSAACRGLCAGSLAAFLLAGCAHGPKPAPAPQPPPPPSAAVAPSAPAGPELTATPGLDPQERLRKLFDLLGDGQRDQARAEAKELLKQQPDNALAANLLNQIDADPKATLGEQNFPYKIRPGETLSILADRYLGDRYDFYILSRYNNIDAPNQARVGQTILIPGAPRKLPPPPAPVLRRRLEPAEAPRRPAPFVAAVPPTPAPRATDPARANALRSRALVEMNKGDINRAVGLLQQAAESDPANTAVAADLARALRIQSATRH